MIGVLVSHAMAKDGEPDTFGREDFFACLRTMPGRREPQTRAEYEAFCGAVDALFDSFDADASGDVDFVEMAAGLTALCGGTPGEKRRVALALFDRDGDGRVDGEQLQAFLAAVDRVASA